MILSYRTSVEYGSDKPSPSPDQEKPMTESTSLDSRLRPAQRLSAQQALGWLVTLGGLAVIARHLLSSLLR